MFNRKQFDSCVLKGTIIGAGRNRTVGHDSVSEGGGMLGRGLGVN